MSDEPKEVERIGKAQVDAVGERLAELLPTLPDQQKLVLAWVLTRAAAARDSDAAEYAASAQGGVLTPALLADAVGMHDVAGYAGGEGSRAIVIRGGRAVSSGDPPTWAFRF